MGVEWTNRYIALEREDSYGVEHGIMTSIAVNAGGSGYNGGGAGTGTWTAGTGPNDLVKGGYGATGTLTADGSGAITAVTLTNHGQGYTSALVTGDITISFGASGGSSATFTIAGRFTSNGITYGEADDESLKQTFDLLTRSDMSRQVASKAVTSTQYGEGSINLAVQPDDFMGNILYAFLPATEEGTAFVDSIDFAGTNTGYTEGLYSLVFSGSNHTGATEKCEAIARVASTGKVTEVNVTNPGKGYSGAPTVSASFGGGSTCSLTVNMGAARKHVFNEAVLSTHAYPSYTMRVGRGDREHTFTGMVASKLTLSANLNEYVMASVDWIGKNEESTSTLRTDVDFAGIAVDALHFADAEVRFDGNTSKTVKVQQISLEININRDLDSAYAVGNRSFTRAPPTTQREITGTMEFNEVIYSDIVDYVNEPTYDDLTGDSVHKIQSGAGKPAITLKFAAEGALTDFIEIELYNVRFEAPEASVSGRDPNRMSVGFQAFYDATSNGAGKAIQVKMLGSGSHVRDSNYSSG